MVKFVRGLLESYRSQESRPPEKYYLCGKSMNG
jgi:hypothetical protein